MDPVTGLAVASVAVGAASSIYNWIAGNSNAANRRRQLAQQRDDALAELGQQYTQGQKQIQQTAGSQLAGEAQNGIIGAPAQSQVDTVAAQNTDQLNQWNTLQTKKINDAYDAGVSDVQNQINQFNLDTFTGLVGTGLSGAAVLVKAGAFNSPAPSPGYFDMSMGALGKTPFEQGGFKLGGNGWAAGSW